LAKIAWKSFPYPAADYDFSGDALQKRWPLLHRGDCEPYPAAANLKKLVASHPDLNPSMSVEQAAKTLQAAWHAYHCGDFGHAIELGLSVGPLGYNVANKAAIIYATYLEGAEKRKLALFLESVERAEEIQACVASMPNAWYFHAQALGRYAQEISVVRALTQGLGGKVKASLERAIALEPHHADAHIGLGAYHAEVIDKIGALIGGLTYGASTASGVKHFEAARKLNPHSAIARIEYANGLMMMFGESKMAQATRLYEDAAKCVAADATERLDIELARSELKE
jgi:hypothetical protein